MNKSMQGFTMLATLFVLIILAITGAYLLKIATVAQQTTNLTLLTTRAEHAALSGLALAEAEWRQHPAQCPERSFHFGPNVKDLNGFVVTITCPQLVTLSEDPAARYAVELEAVSTRGVFGERDYVYRKVNRHLLRV